jgi:hypothetical protein
MGAWASLLLEDWYCAVVAAWARGPCPCLVRCLVLRRLGRAGRYREDAGQGTDAGFVALLDLEVDSGTSTRCTGTGGVARGEVSVSTLCSGTGGSSIGDAGASTLCVGTGSSTTGIRGGIGTGAGLGGGGGGALEHLGDLDVGVCDARAVGEGWDRVGDLVVD